MWTTWHFYWMEWNGTMSFVNSISFYVSISYKNELFSYTSKTFGKFVFSLFWCKKRRIYYMIHVASYHYHPLAKKIYFNTTWHWHMNMCCLITLYMDMLTSFKRLLTKEHMSMQKKMKHLAGENNNGGVVFILFMVLNLLFICSIDHKLYTFEWFFAII